TASILIIEDDADINDVVATFLGKRGFTCTQAYSGSEARLLLQTAAQTQAAFPFDLVLTDLMLPGATGEEIVQLVRVHNDVPIIVISARTTAADKVELLGLGADDYLVKPFDLEEMLARISVQLRHREKSSSALSPRETPKLIFKQWEIDPEARALEAGGTHIKLTRLEYNIVETLVRRPKKVFTKQELYEAAWNEDCFIEEKAINVHMSNIRSKLKDSKTDGYIETVWGIGFKLAE
ncbi:MAG: response regulator transcription factor, partial [Raoultibacter sp.]